MRCCRTRVSMASARRTVERGAVAHRSPTLFVCNGALQGRTAGVCFGRPDAVFGGCASLDENYVLICSVFACCAPQVRVRMRRRVCLTSFVSAHSYAKERNFLSVSRTRRTCATAQSGCCCRRNLHFNIIFESCPLPFNVHSDVVRFFFG